MNSTYASTTPFLSLIFTTALFMATVVVKASTDAAISLSSINIPVWSQSNQLLVHLPKQVLVVASCLL